MALLHRLLDPAWGLEPLIHPAKQSAPRASVPRKTVFATRTAKSLLALECARSRQWLFALQNLSGRESWHAQPTGRSEELCGLNPTTRFRSRRPALP